MKVASVATLSFVVGIVTHALLSPTPPPKPVESVPKVSVETSAVSVPREGERMLNAIRTCLAEHYAEGLGGGGSKLRMDAMKITPGFRDWPLFEIPDGTPTSWEVYIPEDAPQAIPNGAAFVIRPSHGTCGMLAQD